MGNLEYTKKANNSFSTLVPFFLEHPTNVFNAGEKRLPTDGPAKWQESLHHRGT